MKKSVIEKIILVFSIVTMAVGGIVILGWIFDVSIFRSLSPNLVSMKMNTAVAFLFLGAAVLFLEKGRKAASLASSLVVFLIGSLTFLEYLFGWNLGIDELLIKDAPGAVLTAVPGRMAIMTAINFILLGLTLLGIRRYKKASDILSMAVLYNGFLAFLGYLQGVVEFYKIGGTQITAMALHTSIAFMAVSSVILLFEADRGILRIFVSQRNGGKMLRRALFWTVLIVVAISQLIHYLGASLNYFGREFEGAFFTIVTVFFSSFVLFVVAQNLDTEEMKKIEIEASAKKEEKEYRKKLELERDKLKKLATDLEARNKDLQEINAFTAEREQKMNELKEEIIRLKS